MECLTGRLPAIATSRYLNQAADREEPMSAAMNKLGDTSGLTIYRSDAAFQRLVYAQPARAASFFDWCARRPLSR